MEKLNEDPRSTPSPAAAAAAAAVSRTCPRATPPGNNNAWPGGQGGREGGCVCQYARHHILLHTYMIWKNEQVTEAIISRKLGHF